MNFSKIKYDNALHFSVVKENLSNREFALENLRKKLVSRLFVQGYFPASMSAAALDLALLKKSKTKHNKGIRYIKKTIAR